MFYVILSFPTEACRSSAFITLGFLLLCKRREINKCTSGQMYYQSYILQLIWLAPAVFDFIIQAGDTEAKWGGVAGLCLAHTSVMTVTKGPVNRVGGGTAASWITFHNTWAAVSPTGSNQPQIQTQPPSFLPVTSGGGPVLSWGQNIPRHLESENINKYIFRL